MRKLLLLAPLAALSACSGMADRFHTSQSCQQQAGPKPYPAAEVFGLVGALVAESQPERQAWDDRVQSCMKLAGY
jgi:hypothetical protein